MIAGSWLIASVYIERTKQRSSTTCGGVRQQLAEPGARLAVPGELEDRAGQREVAWLADMPVSRWPPDRVGQVLAVHLVEERLVVEQVELRRAAALNR